MNPSKKSWRNFRYVSETIVRSTPKGIFKVTLEGVFRDTPRELSVDTFKGISEDIQEGILELSSRGIQRCSKFAEVLLGLLFLFRMSCRIAKLSINIEIVSWEMSDYVSSGITKSKTCLFPPVPPSFKILYEIFCKVSSGITYSVF